MRVLRNTRAACITVLTLCATFAHAQSDPRIVVPLSDPARPAKLEVSVVNGRISVRGYDGQDIVIVAGDEDSAPLQGPERDGLRRIPNTSLGITAEERDNEVSVTADPGNLPVELTITVPRQTSVRARAVNGGELSVSGVTGEHELSNVNGGVTAEDISGSAVIGTTNGDVDVSFVALTPGKAMSFSSFNGDVTVAFPEDLAANLRISSSRGEILTDFEVQMQRQAPVVERGGDGGRYRVRLERAMTGSVGGGGAELQFQTFNGDIVIRKR